MYMNAFYVYTCQCTLIMIVANTHMGIRLKINKLKRKKNILKSSATFRSIQLQKTNSANCQSKMDFHQKLFTNNYK